VIYATGSTIDWIALWFLPHLFITSIVSFVVIKMMNFESMRGRLIVYFSIALLCLGVYSINIFWHPVASLDKNFIGVSGQPGLPWSMDLIPITSAYLIFGYFLRSKVREFNFNKYGFIASVFIFSLLHYFFNEKIDLNLRVYGGLFVSTIQAFLGIYITLSFASLISSYEFISKKIAYIGAGSIYILIFHILVQLKAFNAMLKVSSNLYINGLVSLAFGVFLPLLFLEISKRSRLISYFLLPLKNNLSIEKYSNKINDSST
jgi:fucose 4-O-acetylase-like acetyltransferase